MIETSGNQISTNKISIKETFAEDMWYSIPNYQRPYVWGEDQLSTLLDDVSHAAEHTPESQYFLGSLVLHCESKKMNGTEYIENSILDGQQRLTSLYMLHAVIRDLTTNEKRRKSCSETIFQEGDPDDGIPERMRLEFPIRSEVSDFVNSYLKTIGGTEKNIELKKLSESSKNASVRNMANAVLIIRQWIDKERDGIVDLIYPYLRTKVVLIYVASGELEDAFRLFTVLNDRGIKLRSSDILKARNLSEVLDLEKQDKYAKFWEDIEGELEEDFDQFLSYIRTILVKEKARHNLLKEFEDNIYNPKTFNQSTKKYEAQEPLLTKGENTFEFVKKYKAHYDALFSEKNFHITNNWAFYNLMKVLEDTALSDIWVPPLLVYREMFGEYRLFDFLVKLDNKFSGDWIARETPTTRIEAMNDIMKVIESEGTGTEKGSNQHADKVLHSDLFDFDQTEFYNQLEHGKIYGRRYARYLLRKVDFLMDAPLYSEMRNSYNTMSVEHILPQNPSPDSEWVQIYSDEKREELTNRLGNLVLISRRKNTGQGRLDYSAKKKKYFENSIETFPNSIRIMQKYDSWGPEDLESNHNSIISKIRQHYV